jgi:hypothetical protein
MSGVVCATQADPRGISPPEKSPNRRVKAIIEPRVVMVIQQKVIPAVKTPIMNKTLNLIKSLCVSESTTHLERPVVPVPGAKWGTYRPKRSAIQPLPTRPTKEPAYPIARRLLAMVEFTPC